MTSSCSLSLNTHQVYNSLSAFPLLEKLNHLSIIPVTLLLIGPIKVFLRLLLFDKEREGLALNLPDSDIHERPSLTSTSVLLRLTLIFLDKFFDGCVIERLL